MGSKALGSEVLAALHLLSKDRVEGVRYIEFVKQGIMTGVLDLIDRGYATKIKTGEDDTNYCLNSRGSEYLDRILRFASEHF